MPKPSATLPHDKATRLADLADKARALGRVEQADRFLLLAWAAYDGVDFVPQAIVHEEPSRRAS